MRRAVALVSCTVAAVATASTPSGAASPAEPPGPPAVVGVDLPLDAGRSPAEVAPALSLSRPDAPPFSAAALSWRADPAVRAVTVRLRYRGEDGWSAWQQVGYDGPGDGARDGTDLDWTGPAGGVEVAVTGADAGRLVDPLLTLIDPGTSPADAAAPEAQGPDTTYDVPKPYIYSRGQWGADPALMTWTPEYAGTVKAVVVHHTATTNAYTIPDVPKIVRAIYYYHSVTLGWGDIGYNFLVDRWGRIIEGRAGGVASTVIGGHAGGFNRYTAGIAMLGTFDEVAPSEAMADSVARLAAWKLSLYGGNPMGSTLLTSAGGGTARYPKGKVVRKPVLMGHRDVGATDCPGTLGYALLNPLRRTVTAIMTAWRRPT
jgi:hypothetical protein